MGSDLELEDGTNPKVESDSFLNGSSSENRSDSASIHSTNPSDSCTDMPCVKNVVAEGSLDDFAANGNVASEVRLSMEGSETPSHEYEVGDMVWGKVKSHPWWPGVVFNEELATTSVRRSKREGLLMVAFFGDSKYGWFDPSKLLPFESSYAEKSRQTTSKISARAVEEAMDEVSRRSALGLSCMCTNKQNFRKTDVKGYFAVDVPDYEPGAVYSINAIKKARDSFQPSSALDFIWQLALEPTREHDGIDFTKKAANVISYRRAVFEKSNESYAQTSGYQSDPPSPGSVKDLPPARSAVKGSRKRGASDRQEELATKKKKKIGDINNLTKKKKVTKNTDDDPPARGIKRSGPVTGQQVMAPTVLVMKFPTGGSLPSIHELKAKFVRFGPMVKDGTWISRKSHKCRVVFKYAAEAHAAYDLATKSGSLFGNFGVKCHIRPLVYFKPRVAGSVQLKSCSKKSRGEDGGNGGNRAARVKSSRREDVPRLEEYVNKHFRDFRHVFCGPLQQVKKMAIEAVEAAVKDLELFAPTNSQHLKDPKDYPNRQRDENSRFISNLDKVPIIEDPLTMQETENSALGKLGSQIDCENLQTSQNAENDANFTIEEC